MIYMGETYAFPHVLCDILYHNIFIHKCRLCIDECIYASGIRAGDTYSVMRNTI